ncbi:hypothetical protein QBC47DRAFT_395156 [Echria macrotheca]|uniref:Uncharacterized protein n=1 Tax=Echria macrotheca TaxID=438768 RepID=A0AAJ0B281_9PEZI|nr:hypothetical protein QBC47DRAFT_395156 [Echria macrotheca]
MSSDVATRAFVRAEIVSLHHDTKSDIAEAVETLRHETKTEFNSLRQTTQRLDANLSQVQTDVSYLKTDVAQLKTDVAQLKTDVAELKTDVAQLKVDVGDIKVTVGEMQISMRQMEIRMRNGRLKNPVARIRPVPIFVHGQGAREPDPEHFPKYADQLYALRKPRKDRDFRMLAYLSKFYDIEQEAANVDQSSQEIQLDPERAVELLEEILGLDEDNFIEFRANAQQLADQKSAPEKRDRPATSSSGEPQPHRRRLESPSEGLPTIPFSHTPSRAPPRAPPAVPADGSPTVPFSETPSRAPGRLAAAGAGPSDGSPTVPFSETPSRAPPRPSNTHTVATRPRRASTVPDSEETGSS